MKQMETDSSPSPLPLHILYRLALSKYFVREAKAKLQHSSDDLALSLVVVNLHDGLDNLLGAVASYIDVQLSEKALLVQTFEAVSQAASEPLPHKMEVLQLNALRIDTKHKGLVPNPKAVLSLAPLLERLCDEICRRFFDKSLMQVSLVDAVEDPRLRERMRQVEGLIDADKFKDALESMAVVLFEQFDFMYIDESGGTGPIFAGTSPIAGPRPLPETQKRVFPSLRVDHVHRIFLEMGIEPDLYHRFHDIVPKVGYDNLRDRNLIIEKDRSTWHMKNWTRENCWFCFDFLTNYLVRRQKGYKGHTIIRRYWKDKIKFIRDSKIYETVEGLEGNVREIMMEAGTSLIGSVKDYVDGAWQGDPEDPFADIILFEKGPPDLRFVRVLKQDVEVVADEVVKDLPFTPW
jgi:hypothetical protein